MMDEHELKNTIADMGNISTMQIGLRIYDLWGKCTIKLYRAKWADTPIYYIYWSIKKQDWAVMCVEGEYFYSADNIDETIKLLQAAKTIIESGVLNYQPSQK